MTSTADLSGTAFGNVDAVGDTPQVLSYLDLASVCFRDLKRRSYRSLPLRPGASVLDVGCGSER